MAIEDLSRLIIPGVMPTTRDLTRLSVPSAMPTIATAGVMPQAAPAAQAQPTLSPTAKYIADMQALMGGGIGKLGKNIERNISDLNLNKNKHGHSSA